MMTVNINAHKYPCYVSLNISYIDQHLAHCIYKDNVGRHFGG